jgi:hypothetical protein
MDNSYHLFTRYLAEKTKGKRLWVDTLNSSLPSLLIPLPFLQ